MQILKRMILGLGRLFGTTVSLSLASLAVVMGATVFLSASVIRKNPEMLGLLKGPEILEKEEEVFVAKVGESISLPTDEKPTVVKVSDLDNLSGQTFFKDARDDDKVLIYTNAKKVILYRPAENRVVEVGSVNISQDKKEGEGEVAGQQEIKISPFKVALLNGTEEAGLTQRLEEELKKLLPEGEVVFRASTVNLEYEKSVVVDLTGERKVETEELASRLGMEVGSLPEGETKPKDGEVLVIMGKDKVSNNL